MSSIDQAGSFVLGHHAVKRVGYGAMQLAGPGAFGPPKDRNAALVVLRQAVACGVNHIDTSDYYGPHVTNELIRQALHPYPDDLVIVTKIGARRGEDASWLPAFSPEQLTRAVHDNLRNLALDVLTVVNLRIMFDPHGPAEGSIEAPLTVLAELQRIDLVRHIGLSNVTPTQIAEGQRNCKIVCVQNHYNLAHRHDDGLIDELAQSGIAYVPFFSARRVQPAAVVCPFRRCSASWRDSDAGCACVAAPPCAQYPADPRNLVRHASSGEPGCSQAQSAGGRA